MLSYMENVYFYINKKGIKGAWHFYCGGNLYPHIQIDINTDT